ncbi:MAG: DUF2946 family protein [Burkholderiales bacterium]
MKSVRLIVAWLLMLALPLQAIAAFAPLAACGDEHAAAMQASHDSHAGHPAANANHEHHGATSHPHSGDDPSADGGSHSCCHHVFTGAAATSAQDTPEAPRAEIQRVTLLHTLHIPELPQRPPRA